MPSPGWLAGWQNAPPEVSDDTDRLVLQYADPLTRDATVDDALWQALAGRFSQTEIPSSSASALVLPTWSNAFTQRFIPMSMLTQADG
jgi:hypothetical protein